MFINVDLPAPFSPSSASTSPGAMARSTPASATTPGKVLTIPRSSTRGWRIRLLRRRRLPFDALQQPVEAQDLLERHDLAGWQALLAALIAQGSLKHLERAVHDALSSLIDQGDDIGRDLAVHRAQADHLVRQPAVVILRLELLVRDTSYVCDIYLLP